MKTRIVALCAIIALDAAGIGLIYPILPQLLRALTGTTEISALYGAILALYALMQLALSPVLGALSDRVGRRPVLLVSLAGATIDYLIMAFASNVKILIAGRAVAGITSASLAVAMAYVADTTDERGRASAIGYLQAAFGVGFFVGPILGGIAGGVDVRLPFLAAAILSGVTFTVTFFGLPESRRGGGAITVAALNPLGRIRWAIGVAPLLPLLTIHLVIGVIGNLSSTIWVLYGQDRFHWDGRLTGYSLALLGACHALAQGGLTGPITARLGERATVAFGIVCDVFAMISIGVATRGWVVFALAPVFSLGAIGLPALQSLTTRHVVDAKQGELQGVLASVTSLSAIVGPLIAAAVYVSTKQTWLGATWIVGAALYALCVPLLGRRADDAGNKPRSRSI